MSRSKRNEIVDKLTEAELKAQPDPRGYKATEKGDALEVLSISDRIRTIDDAFKFGGYDPAIWQVHASECKAYQCCIKNSEKRPEVVQLWAIKLTLRRKVTKNEQSEAEGLLDRIRKHAPKYPKLGPSKSLDDPHMFELSLMDVHFGNLAWRHETGQDCDLNITRKNYVHAVADLVGKVSSFNVEKFLLPIGNDFMHVDTQLNTTTKGTPVDADGRYPKIWETAKFACIETIERLMSIAPVEILWVPGNHDQQASFHLCEVLGAWFRLADRFTYSQCDKYTGRKYVPYGPAVVGFTHGDEEKHSDLPAIMLHEARELMATRRTLEIHLGHLHRAKETKHINTDTHAGGVRVRVLPSLSGTNKWHHSKGYVGSMQAAEAYLWSEKTGYVGHFSANVSE